MKASSRGPGKGDSARDGLLGLGAGTGDTTHPRGHEREGTGTGSKKAGEPQSYLEGGDVYSATL